MVNGSFNAVKKGYPPECLRLAVVCNLCFHYTLVAESQGIYEFSRHRGFLAIRGRTLLLTLVDWVLLVSAIDARQAVSRFFRSPSTS